MKTPKAPKRKRSLANDDTNSKTVVFRRPVWDAFQLSYAKSVALKYAQSYPTDPFAYSRILLYMRQGIEAVSDVLDEATRRLSPSVAASV